MTQFHLDGAHPTWRPDDPPITIRVDGEQFVVRAGGPLDHDATAALVEAIEAAVAAGAIAVLDLTDDAAIGELDAGMLRTGATPAAGATAQVTVLGFGLLLLATASEPWTVDVRARRLCRGPAAATPRFVPPSAWIGLRSLAVASHSVVAVTSAGDHIVASRHLDGT